LSCTGCHAAASQSKVTGLDGAVAAVMGSNVAEQKLCSKASTVASSFQRLRCIKCLFFFPPLLFLTPRTRITALLLLIQDTFKMIFLKHLSIKRMRSLYNHDTCKWLSLAGWAFREI